MPTSTKHFVLCIESGDAEDLEKGKVYQSLPDVKTEAEGLLRVIDESLEDYLYPTEYFVELQLPQRVIDALAA
ncbi:MAG: hypothetical protein N838_09405 [Thiohalocapsa sp. PB-PSB1]|jgi:hypothetical protein|nr:MAG: hypothetical protein N838_29965 [Thiohalocapsa sp. PB-PSB1]QQO53538.1 MAG: hypothetical protein N838_09405 [Thiohalocapsa sp. PB-PSB1]HCS90345.1 hypothetical protein [Chromatiaceae bacterium]